MTEKQFISLRAPKWKEFEKILAERPKRRLRRGLHETITFPRTYRNICRDLNDARAERYSLALIERLNRLVLMGHHLLYGSRVESPWRAVTFFTAEFPRAVRRFGKAVLLCHLLFYSIVGLTWLFALHSQDRASLVLGRNTAQSLLEMYDPTSPHFLKPRDVQTDANMFGYYIANNVSIGFRTFAGGALAGLGSLFLLAYNALFLGAAIALIDAAGFDGTFFPFIIGHSAFELTAVIIFALSGFLLGKALLMPGRFSRTEALRRTGGEVLPLVGGAAVFLFFAASIEAFWSSHIMDSWIKYAVGSAVWITVFLFLRFGGRGERQSS